MDKFNAEDMKDHRTVALALMVNDKYLFSINLKHRMITFPVGKVRDDETLKQGLRREISEELGVDLKAYCRESFYGLPCYFEPTLVHTYMKQYDFTGKTVNVETNIFLLTDAPMLESMLLKIRNAEPKKCGGIFYARTEDAIHMARSLNLKIADCVMEYLRWAQTLEHQH